MSTTLTVMAEYDVSLDECMAFMSDPGLHAHLATMEGLTHRRVCNIRQEGRTRWWDVELRVDMEIPAIARALLRPDQLRWVQHFELDLDSLRFRYRIHHPLPSHLMEVEGTGWMRPLDETRSCLEIEVRFHSSVALIGRRLEATAAERTKSMLELDNRYRREYMAMHRGQARPIEVTGNTTPLDLDGR